MSHVRFVAVVPPATPAGAPVFCGHVHLKERLASQCAALLRMRFPGQNVQVARSCDANWDSCPMHDSHGQGRECPLCHSKGIELEAGR